MELLKTLCVLLLLFIAYVGFSYIENLADEEKKKQAEEYCQKYAADCDCKVNISYSGRYGTKHYNVTYTCNGNTFLKEF